MSSIQVASTLNLGASTLGFALPVRTGLQALVIPTLTYKSGSSMTNLAYPGATSLSVAGSPTFDTYGMTVNTQGDGLLSTVFDAVAAGNVNGDGLGDFTAYVCMTCEDQNGNGQTSPTFLSNYNQDTGYPTGSKGLAFGVSSNSGNTGVISAISRNGSGVVAVTLSSALGTAYVAGQYVTIGGITGDTTFNGVGFIVAASPAPTTTTFSYACPGTADSGTCSGSSWCNNGAGKMNLVDTACVLSGTAVTVTAISRVGTTVTATVASLPTGVSGANIPIIIAGVTGDLSFNGSYTTLTASGTTITMTCSAGLVADSGTVTGATLGLGVLSKTSTTNTAGTFYNIPTGRFVAVTVASATGVRTVYDLSAGGSTGTATIVGTRIQPIIPSSFLFGSGLTVSTFGKFKMFSAGLHIGACLTLAQLQQNYAVLASKTGFG